MIGDPRDVGERTLNDVDTVAEWTERIRGQLERFVDFSDSGDSPTGAIVENNIEWTSAMSAIEFLRDVGKHFSVNVMLDRDTVRRRLEGRASPTPNSATCCCRPTTTSNYTGATAVLCRSAVPISGATSSPEFGWCAKSSVPQCMRSPSRW
ncbi:tRNA synthetases class I family protein [Mycobacterium kansasii]|uniref:tRNA synthetases class I family protein n=1 Tax=Mycobacterium kansasii TaxID=1768 RepID=A0A1V3WCW9_MYCKA|nr:tRNA synthetases class I family protein [Mycobacterium kansasii]